MYARQTGKTPFVIYQGAWSVFQRDLEREIIPMAREEGGFLCFLFDISHFPTHFLSIKGMALAPWYVLATGKIRTDEEEDKRRATGEKGSAHPIYFSDLSH